MKKFIEDLKIAVVIVIAISIVTILINIFTEGLSLRMVKSQVFYNAYYGIPLSLVNGYLFDTMDNKWPWEKYIYQRVWYGAIGSILVTMLTVVLLNLILWVWIWDNEYTILFAKSHRGFYVIALVITIVTSAMIHSYHFFKKLLVQSDLNDALEKERLKAELSALKSQLDPHFLFNSLNVLSGLIDEDREKAQQFLSGMSGIFRYILEYRDEDMIELRDELAFAEKYLSLHAMRFENSLQLVQDIPEDYLNKKLPVLTLQLLLENAIKHNRFDKNVPLKVMIEGKEGKLEVSNPKAPRKVIQSSKLGLKNIQDRYRLLTNQEIEVKEDKDEFKVVLGLI